MGHVRAEKHIWTSCDRAKPAAALHEPQGAVERKHDSKGWQDVSTMQRYQTAAEWVVVDWPFPEKLRKSKTSRLLAAC